MINFKAYPQLTEINIPDLVRSSTTSYYNAFRGMTNLQKISNIHKNVTNMAYAYQYCTNLTTAVCGPNVTNMRNAYNNCRNLTTAVCGPNVTDMGGAYYNCTNLTTAVCGNKVTNMSYAYQNCTNLTTAVCGPNVTNMSYAYQNCTNLTTAVCGPNVTNMSYAYQNCTNIQGNVYFYSNNISNMVSCFNGRNNSKMLNIYVHNGSTTLSKCIDTSSLTNKYTIWTDATSTNGCYYNTTRNIYIYPVANVEEARIANGD